MLHTVLSRLDHCLFILLLHSSDPHDPLLKKLLGSIFIVGMIDLVDIFGTLVDVIEFKDFLCRDNRVVVTEDE